MCFHPAVLQLGLQYLPANGNFNQYASFLVGDILSISQTELIYLVISFVVVLLVWSILFNQLHAISMHAEIAKSKGMKVNLIDHIFVILIAVVVMLSIRWVGILLINSLLILPAAASRNISRNMRQYHLFGILFALFSGITGLILSYYNGISTGPMIVILASGIYFVTFFLGKKIKG